MTDEVSHRSDRTSLGGRFTQVTNRVGQRRASRSERVRAQRSALAMSEEARIRAQMRYGRVKYRHTAVQLR